jgi:UPF0716 protein FxsA
VVLKILLTDLSKQLKHKIMKILFPLFAIATLIEIYTIIQVGEVIGGFNTIILIILTAGIGSFLVKQQGIATLANAQNKINTGNLPATEMLEGVMIFISGILLLTPGFITDFIGILGLVPFIRQKIIAKFSVQTKFNATQRNQRNYTNHNNIDNGVIDAEFWEDKK